jgi:hypothetical protein
MLRFQGPVGRSDWSHPKERALQSQSFTGAITDA